ncbi:MAG: response regulator transcription factor [Terriglobales bacterium]
MDKSARREVLLKSIRCVAAGEYWIDRNTLAEWGKQPRGPALPASSLTKREYEVVAAVVSGATNKAIAEEFAISEDTVKRHLTNIYDKLGVSTRLELALFAVTRKLVPTR